MGFCLPWNFAPCNSLLLKAGEGQVHKGIIGWSRIRHGMGVRKVYSSQWARCFEMPGVWGRSAWLQWPSTNGKFRGTIAPEWWAFSAPHGRWPGLFGSPAHRNSGLRVGEPAATGQLQPQRLGRDDAVPTGQAASTRPDSAWCRSWHTWRGFRHVRCNGKLRQGGIWHCKRY